MISRNYIKPSSAALLGCLVVLLACSSVTGCKHNMAKVSHGPPETPSSGAHYAHLFGQRYRTKVDLYLFIFTADPDYKYLGMNGGRSKFLPGTLLPAINRQQIGKTYGEIKILDVVPAGSELTIEAETHEVTAFSGIRGTAGFPMGFICRLAYNGKQLNGILSEFIQSRKEGSAETPNQEIDETIAEKLSTKAADAAAFAAPTGLTAILADPINIDLKWKDNATDEAGYFVEYSPDANQDFVIVEALPPNTTTFRHADLMPQTKFVYRVRPFFGKASDIAEVMTGKGGIQQAPAANLVDSERAKTVPGVAEIKKSIRSTLTTAEAAATGLRATLIPPAGVKLEWKDHARDADGYLVEIKQGSNSDFTVSVFLDPGTTSWISYDFPLKTKFFFRVRAFFYGEPSNLAENTTGRDLSNNL